jgi:hypothetical protein
LSTRRPLKIRVGIRDQWESPRAPIATSIDSLAKTLGYTISPQIQWSMLYATLKDTFVDQGMFVSAVCRIGIAFYGRMLSRIEDKTMADWTDSLLDGMAKQEAWVLRIEVWITTCFSFSILFQLQIIGLRRPIAAAPTINMG